MKRVLRSLACVACGAVLGTSAQAFVTLASWTHGAYPFNDVYYSSSTNLLWYSKSPTQHDPADPYANQYEWYYDNPASQQGAYRWAMNLQLASGGVTLGDWRPPEVVVSVDPNGQKAFAGEIDAMLAEIGGSAKMQDYFLGINAMGTGWPYMVWTQTWDIGNPNPHVWAYNVPGNVYQPASVTLAWYQAYMTTFAVMPATGIQGGGPATVPEPGVLLLLGYGAAAAAFVRRRKAGAAG